MGTPTYNPSQPSIPDTQVSRLLTQAFSSKQFWWGLIYTAQTQAGSDSQPLVIKSEVTPGKEWDVRTGGTDTCFRHGRRVSCLAICTRFRFRRYPEACFHLAIQPAQFNQHLREILRTLFSKECPKCFKQLGASSLGVCLHITDTT